MVPQQIQVAPGRSRPKAVRDFPAFCQERRIVLHGNNFLTGEQADSSVAPDPAEYGEPAPEPRNIHTHKLTRAASHEPSPCCSSEPQPIVLVAACVD
ncbi:hypothetical protein [Nocardia sp. NBC_01327]|uniref:hypothetical protein n=1 Tax=Nocardia sp. NBC_01327 TaxID=2903593 RepID=UPI002E135A74|nr:hypothetical protein OG326_22480 [Nocardia sp. NBC_01327]